MKNLLILGLLLSGWLSVFADTRIKDVATVQGARDNQLIGYGVVAGLDGQGDSSKLLTQQSISNMMMKFGFHIAPIDITSRNVAVVMVTAKIPAFSRQGAKLDAVVSSIADAKSLQGGVLLQTPMVGGDGQVYAVAQGSISLGGFLAGTGGAGGSSVQKNHTNSGFVTSGVIVENEIPTTVFSNGVVQLVLRDSDFTSAVRMSNAINEQIGPMAQAISPTTVEVFVPVEMRAAERQMEFIARLENVNFDPDRAARIVVNERTGTVVANENIQIAKVAIAHGNLTVAISSSPLVSQPNAFTGNGNVTKGNTLNANGGSTVTVGGTGGVGTAIVNRTTTNVQEDRRSMAVLQPMPTVEDVAFALNSLGATPRELMSILQGIKDAGALQAELVLE